MAIKKYYAIADNTITNAYKEDLSTRATGSNMGRSDILEVFSLYAQQNSGSSEIARTLILFPTSSICQDRAAGTIPESGSVSWYLNLYNAKHSKTLPEDYTLTITMVSGAWQEGRGLDMETYKDETYDKVGSNWINASGIANAASASVTVANGAAANGMSEKQHITITSTTGTTKRYVITNAANDAATDTGTILSDSADTDTGTGTAGADEDGGVAVSINLSSATQNDYLTALKAAIEHENGHNGEITVSTVSNGSITLTQATTGMGGNRSITTNTSNITVKHFFGGAGAWENQGGDTYYPGNESFIDQRLPVGDEDINLNVTMLVEQWLQANPAPNHGFMIRLSSSLEPSSSSNLTGSIYSYYTKKFFGRGSEYFFKRPTLEARWDNVRKDNRGNFYSSSSLAPPSDNLNTLYLYNYVRGRLRDIGNRSSNLPIMRLFYSSGSVPEGNELGFLTMSSPSNLDTVHGGGTKATRISTGIYKCEVAVTAGATNGTYQYLQDVWYTRESDGQDIQLFTGSAISPKRFSFSAHNPAGKYVLTVLNNKKSYHAEMTERIRLYVREKNWSPNIYTRAKSKPDNIMIESASYQINRTVDDAVVIPYGTGSDNHTVLSYDVSGNYFDLDMKLLEPGYTYDLKFSFYEDSISSWREQPYIFKIRVDKDEY